jgi:hypothetical protein
MLNKFIYYLILNIILVVKITLIPVCATVFGFVGLGQTVKEIGIVLFCCEHLPEFQGKVCKAAYLGSSTSLLVSFSTSLKKCILKNRQFFTTLC